MQDVQGPDWEVTARLVGHTIRRILGYQLTIAQLIGLGLIVGTPYLLIGAIWSTTHTAHLQNMHGVDLAVSFLGSIVSVAGAAVLECLHDMTAKAAGIPTMPRFTYLDTRPDLRGDP